MELVVIILHFANLCLPHLSGNLDPAFIFSTQVSSYPVRRRVEVAEQQFKCVPFYFVVKNYLFRTEVSSNFARAQEINGIALCVFVKSIPQVSS